MTPAVQRQTLTLRIVPTGGMDRFQRVTLGALRLRKGGPFDLVIRPDERFSPVNLAAMVLKKVP